MKIVTQDYGCGTSSSILDYGIKDVVIVSPNDYGHVFTIQDDLFFVGHDFLFFLWDTKEKVERWKAHNFRKAVWCFERIDAIVPAWQQKSQHSLSILKQFVDQVYVCDEDDAEKYGDWFPQWASLKFFEMKNNKPTIYDKYLFSGQAGKPEYHLRNELLNNIFSDPELKDLFQVTNINRTLTWENYCKNMLNYTSIVNPVGILRGFNTRTYEVLYSGRNLLQQTYGKYSRHEKLLSGHSNAILFKTFGEMKEKVLKNYSNESKPRKFYEKNSLYARFKSIGVDIK